MAPRRPKGPDPDDVPRQLTPEDIEVGIRKLNRRIEEVKALADGTIRYDDARVQNATRNIRADLTEIFGKAAPESYALGGRTLSHPSSTYGVSDGQFQGEFLRNLPNVLRILEGLIQRLEEKREDLGGNPTARVQASFEGLDLHPRIAGVCAELYRGGHYRNAVLDASVALVNLVKEKSRRHDLDGAGLMTTVFSKNKPVLAFNELKDKTDEDEQEGMMYLFMGAVLALRNPRAHALPDDSPEMALEYIGLISLLAKRAEQARRTTP